MSGSDWDTTSFGPFRLRPATRTIEKNGVPLEIGNRALDILIVLVERAGEVVSHKELLGRAWRGLVVEPGNLRVHVSGLRKALGDSAGKSRYIASVPGQGYCFVAPISRESFSDVPASTAQGTPLAAPQKFTLPPVLARMVGRDDVVRTIAADLIANRFITIIGPGGIGKTTVAVSVAHALRDEFVGNVCFVDFGAVTDDQLLPATVASTLGISIQSAAVLPTLMSFLRTSRMLLVLDNCEHVIDGAASLSETIISEASGVHVLATSREALRVEGEHAHWLHALESPPQDAIIAAEAALAFPAVRLFVERAAESDARFELTDANAAMVADICGRLDGIALAIELVAGRVGSYGLEGTADLLTKQLELHWQGRRTAIPRHQTLHALLGWSYGLLPESEQRVLRKLSVFVGTFSLEAAQAVAADIGLDEARLAAAIDSLIAKSLVSTARMEEGSTRYRLLEATRVFAIKQLEERGESDETAERHARYFARLLGSRANAQRSSDLHGYLGNLRAALEWCFPRDRELGVELALAAVPVLLAFSLWHECLKWSDAALLVLPDSKRGERPELVLQEAIAVSSMFTGASAVQAAIVRALEIARHVGDTATHLRLLASLHFYLTRKTDFTGALSIAEEMDAVAERSNDRGFSAISDWLRGSSQMCLGNQRIAMDLFEHGFADGADREVGNAHQLGIYYRTRALVGLARTRWLCGYPDGALLAARQSLAEAAETPLVNRSYALLITCHVFLWCGDFRTAQRVIENVMNQPHWQGRLVWFHAEALALKGELLVRSGRIEEGIELLRDALSELSAKSHQNLMLTVAASCLAEGLSAMRRSDEALAVIDDAIAHGQRVLPTWEVPELLRVRANVLLAMPGPDEAGAERCLMQSLALARRQSAKSWELRTAITLSSHWAKRGRALEGHRLLSSVYSDFSEGFKTTDLETARRVLEELAPPV